MKLSLSAWVLGVAACGALVVTSSCGASSGGESGENESAASSEMDPDEMAEQEENAEGSATGGENTAGEDEGSSESSELPASGNDEGSSSNVDGDSAGEPGAEADDEAADDGDADGDAEGGDPDEPDPMTGDDEDGMSSMDDEPDTGEGEDGDAGDEDAMDCTNRCPVPRICMPCGDDCAEAFVPCDAEGECGEVEWLCDEEETDPGPEPGPINGRCPALCPVPAVCQLCDDGSCASPDVSCNDDGSCGAIDWQCDGASVDPDPAEGIECRSVDDCPQIVTVCRDCPDGGMVCPVMQCIDNECTVTGNECGESDAEYDPCAGKEDGEYCTLCAPGDADCVETDEIKTCTDGKCSSGVSISIE